MGSNKSDKLEKSLENKITKILTQDSELISLLTEPPKAFIIPVVKPHPGKAVVIWLYFRQKEVSHKNILWAFLTMIRLLPYKKSCFDDFVGVDVVPSIRLINGETDRIVRISVWKRGYSNALQLEVHDTCKLYPIDGVQFGWYWDPKSVSE